jgi:hypothetical protein
MYSKGGRQELVDKETVELGIIEAFLVRNSAICSPQKCNLVIIVCKLLLRCCVTAADAVSSATSTLQVQLSSCSYHTCC